MKLLRERRVEGCVTKELAQRNGFGCAVGKVGSNVIDVVGFTGQDHIGPRDVVARKLMTSMSTVVVLPDVVEGEKGVSGARAHRTSFNDVGAGGANLPVIAIGFSEGGQHVTQHHRTRDITRAQRDNFHGRLYSFIRRGRSARRFSSTTNGRLRGSKSRK